MMPGKIPRQPKPKAQREWDVDEIQKLIDLLVAREITEFEMKKGGIRIRIKRGNALAEAAPRLAYSEPSISPPPALSAQPGPALEPPSAASTPPAAETSEHAEGLHLIKSPIVGTFFAAPAPNAPPFVKVGDVVAVGQVLCIIEAMKLMNEIEAEVAGEIVRGYVENGQPVEYGQTLFAISPSRG